MDLVSQNLLLTSGGKKDSTFVDDVFSTYLYNGNAAKKAISNKIKLGNANAGNSVEFSGFSTTDDYLQMAHTTDLCFGNGDFTIECWAFAAKHDGWNAVFGNWDSGTNGYVLETVSGDLEFYWYNAAGSYTLVQGAAVPVGEWSHLCVCRSGNTLRVFVNGTMYGSGVSMTEGIRDGTTDFTIGGRVAGGGWWNGNITNLRVTKGQGLYTSNFTPSTAPFTTTSQGATASNVKLLCCNKDTVTGSTVTPGTITANGNPTASNFGTGTASDGEGGMVWIKNRDNGGAYSQIFDTERGATKQLSSSEAMGQNTVADTLTDFNNNGFSLGANAGVNGQNEIVSWTFRKAKGFFDVVTYNGNGSGLITVNHNLGSVPGFIALKKSNGSDSWICWHDHMPYSNNANYLKLNQDTSMGTDGANPPNASINSVTSTQLVIGADNNATGSTYVVYLWAGGASDEPGSARSVDFDGSGDYLSLASSPDLAMGTGDFTVEGWFKINSGSNYAFWMNGANGLGGDLGVCVWYYSGSSYGLTFNNGSDQTTNVHPPAGQWFHLAYVRSSGTTSLYYNGQLLKSASNTINYTNQTFVIGGYTSTSYLMNGSVSNFRIVKGTAVYTSSFKPPTQGLTDITNTKLLCCNKNTVTGSTVTPGTITSNGNPQSSTDTPFDDPEGFKFGEEGDQNLVQCGSYRGNGSSNGPDVYLGWEPQWVLIKNVSSGSNSWNMWDSMRGITTNGNDNQLYPDRTQEEYETADRIDLTSTGFKLKQNSSLINSNGDTYIYMCIRRPDGYCGKPPEFGSSVFNIDLGGINSGNPSWISGFPVDMQFIKDRNGTTYNWFLSTRLTEKNYLSTMSSGSENGNSVYVHDYQDGWGYYANGDTPNITSWMWQRGAGFDVVCYDGLGASSAPRSYAHSLGKPPEMIWSKGRSSSYSWRVWHKDLGGGGASAAPYYLVLNGTDTQSANGDVFGGSGNLLPTSTHWTTGGNAAINESGTDQITMLFASVDKISKVGSYTGSNYDQTITLGFRPRFLIVKAYDKAYSWLQVDTTRGWVAGNNSKYLFLELNWAQNNIDVGYPTSTGFVAKGGSGNISESGTSYIYYAHA